MQSQDVATRPEETPGPVVDVEQAEAALMEHYPRLVRLAYLVLPPKLGTGRRVLTAHALAQRALPRSRSTAPAATAVRLPGQRGPGDGGPVTDPGYALVRERVLRTALEACLPLRRMAWPRRAQLPALLPHVWGLRLFPRSGGTGELALEQRLSALSPAGRAACALLGPERLTEDEAFDLLDAAGVDDPDAALDEATGPGGGDAPAAETVRLLSSPEFDPCVLHARPTDLLRRRQHLRAAGVAAAAVLVCGALLGMPGDGWGPDGAAAPPYARNPAGQAALDPERLMTVAPAAWRSAARRDFAVWPARGSLVRDRELLRRALAVWARPGRQVHVSATPGTPAGAPPGPPRLLYAGRVDGARVVLLYDGMRIARYAEPAHGTAGAALDFSRVDGPAEGESDAVVLDRSDGNVRYLTAPWVRSTAVRDLLKPQSPAKPLHRTADGVTEPMAGPPVRGGCSSWRTLQVRPADDGSPDSGASDASGTGDGVTGNGVTGESGTGNGLAGNGLAGNGLAGNGSSGGGRLLTDLGELTPAHLTAGRPGSPGEATGEQALADWSATACSLAALRSEGVRTVNAWPYAQQQLPEGNGQAAWLCTRADTWRGTGTRVLAQVRTPGNTAAAIAAQARDTPDCGSRAPRVLAGVLWKSQAGTWYLLGAGSENVASVRASGDVDGSAEGNVLAVPAEQGAKARLDGTLTDGDKLEPLH
ncbi:hypothetical protein [Streptomyces sp. NPDC058045]|uniref:hypothetical protein n=1 Tax=Streptomyces sp. NPDC058045 TaxID=3346311 RepID=UPI0036E25651